MNVFSFLSGGSNDGGQDRHASLATEGTPGQEERWKILVAVQLNWYFPLAMLIGRKKKGIKTKLMRPGSAWESANDGLGLQQMFSNVQLWYQEVGLGPAAVGHQSALTGGAA